jgi:hypothetical protein
MPARAIRVSRSNRSRAAIDLLAPLCRYPCRGSDRRASRAADGGTHILEAAASKVIIGLSTSVDGMASGTTEDDFMAVHEAVLGWVFNLRSWQVAQGIEGGHDTAGSSDARSSGAACSAR